MSTERDNTQPVDWRSIRENLDWNTSQQETLQLRQRATQYAAPLRQTIDNTEAILTVLAFSLGSEQYGVNVMNVQTVRALPNLTPIPGVPRFYPGVVNLRGQIITVLDLRPFFNPAGADTSPAHELVIIRANNLELGLLANHVHGVQSIHRQQIQSVDYMQYAIGVTADRLVMLDIEALCEDERLIVGGQED